MENSAASGARGEVLGRVPYFASLPTTELSRLASRVHGANFEQLAARIGTVRELVARAFSEP